MDEETAGEIAQLRQRVYALEQRLPNSKIISPKFWWRAFTTVGYYFAALGVIYGIILAIALIVWLVGLLIRAATS